MLRAEQTLSQESVLLVFSFGPNLKSATKYYKCPTVAFSLSMLQITSHRLHLIFAASFNFMGVKSSNCTPTIQALICISRACNCFDKLEGHACGQLYMTGHSELLCIQYSLCHEGKSLNAAWNILGPWFSAVSTSLARFILVSYHNKQISTQVLTNFKSIHGVLLKNHSCQILNFKRLHFPYTVYKGLELSK